MEDTNYTEENTAKEEKTMTESEFLEAKKEALKKNISTWTGVLIFLAVVGLPLCIVVYGIAMEVMFVINLLAFQKTKKFLERMENGEVSVKEVYEFLETMQRRGTKMFMLNLFLGLGVGLIGTLNDLKISEAGIKEGLDILGDDYKSDRIANDPKAQWRYCVYCKKNKTEAFNLYKLTDGVICSSCLSKYSSMLPKRAEDPATPSLKTAHYINPVNSIGKLSSKDLDARLEYLKKNQEEYSGFTPTRVICEDMLELDETNSLFRIASASEYEGARAGVTSGLVHSYSAIKGIAYELIYEYETPNDNTSGGWKYTGHNSVIFAIDDNPYLKEETFTLKHIPTKLFESSKKPQNEYAEQTVKELQEIFNKPVLEKRVLHR